MASWNRRYLIPSFESAMPYAMRSSVHFEVTKIELFGEIDIALIRIFYEQKIYLALSSSIWVGFEWWDLYFICLLSTVSPSYDIFWCPSPCICGIEDVITYSANTWSAFSISHRMKVLNSFWYQSRYDSIEYFAELGRCDQIDSNELFNIRTLLSSICNMRYERKLFTSTDRRFHLGENPVGTIRTCICYRLHR